MSGERNDAPVVRKNSLWRTVKAVAWSFIGVRKNSGFQEDVAQITPFQVIFVGIAGALLLVVGLIALVNWVVLK